MAIKEDSTIAKSPPVSQGSRLGWLDAARGLAVVGMLETHAVNSFLAPDWAAKGFFRELNFYNGLVAPSFLLIAGYAQGLSARRSAEKPRQPFSWRRLGRLGWIATLGYALHIPWARLTQGDFSPAFWREWCAGDILQVMAVSLAALLVLGHWCRKWADAAVLALLAASLALSIPSVNLHTGLPLVDGYFAWDGSSLFTLLPWLGFAASGFLLSRLHTAPQRTWLLCAAASAGLAWLGERCMPYPFVGAHPWFFIMRLGWLLAPGTLLALAWRRWQPPAWLQLAGRHSLFIYAGHLALIHALPLPFHTLHQSPGQTLGPAGTSALFLAILGLCLGTSLLLEKRAASRLREK